MAIQIKNSRRAGMVTVTFIFWEGDGTRRPSENFAYVSWLCVHKQYVAHIFYMQLLVACMKNDVASAKRLVQKRGCDPAQKDKQGNTPLSVAALSGSLDILMYLIEKRKCSPGCPGQWGRSLLHNACQKNGNLASGQFRGTIL